jgi:hypothetical protein
MTTIAGSDLLKVPEELSSMLSSRTKLTTFSASRPSSGRAIVRLPRRNRLPGHLSRQAHAEPSLAHQSANGLLRRVVTSRLMAFTSTGGLDVCSIE